MGNLMAKELFLGYVCERFLAGGRKVSLLRPVNQFGNDNQRWTPIDNVSRGFPNRGCVTWLTDSDDALEGSVWVFECSPHDTFDATSQRSDKYRIDFDRQPEQPVEVIRLHTSDAEAAQRAIRRGLLLDYPPTRQSYIVLDENSWVGPVRLLQKGERWFIDPQQLLNPLNCVAPVRDSDLFNVRFDGHDQVILRHKVRPTKKLEELDWADDVLTLKRVMEWARDQPKIAEPLKLTKAIIKQTVEQITVDEVTILAQRVRRARSYVEKLSKLTTDTASFEKEFLALPSVEARIAAVEHKARSAAKAQAESEAIAKAKVALEAMRQEQKHLTEEIAAKRRELEAIEKRRKDSEKQARDDVDVEMKRRNQELEVLDKALAQRRRQLDGEVESVDTAVSERIAELMRRPADALAQIAIVRAALSLQTPIALPSSNGIEHGVSSMTTMRLTPPPSVLFLGEAPIIDHKQLITAARQAALVAGEGASFGVALHSAFISGLMPLLAGPGALDILENYARAATGGRMILVTVPPTTFEPADLLGRINTRTGHLAPHPSGLLDLLIFANQPEQRDTLFMVVFDGVNRAAVDAYLLPILECYRVAWEENLHRALHIVHSSALAIDDVYASAAHLNWPRNVLLAGTLVEGGATVPLPPALWSHALLLNIGRSQSIEKSNSNATQQMTSASLDIWTSWHKSATADLQDGAEALNTVNVDGIRLPTSVARSFARAYVASRPALKSDNDALRVATRGILAPYALTTGQTEALVQILEVAELGIGEDELETVRQVVG